VRVPSRFARRSEFESNMTPMIDVVFLLLVFFLWTSSFQITEYALPTDVAVAGGSQQPVETPPEQSDLPPVVIKIVNQGGRIGWLIDGQSQRDLAAVGQTLGQLSALSFDVPVILDVEGNVPLGNVIDVYDLCLQKNFDTVQFAASVDAL